MLGGGGGAASLVLSRMCEYGVILILIKTLIEGICVFYDLEMYP